MMWDQYNIGLLIVLISGVIGFLALAIETDDLHRLLLLDLAEITTLGVIALLGTDLAEALVLPGLTVGIAELLALSQIYITKEGLKERPVKGLNIEVIQKADAPMIISVFLVVYGLLLSGFTGGGVAGLGLVFYFMSRRYKENLNMLGKRHLMGYLDLCFLCLHVPSPVLVYRSYGCCRGHRAQGDCQDVPCGYHVG
jgi:energy-converting hydrogenase A subunit G